MSPTSPKIVSPRIEGLQMLSARSYEGSITSARSYEGSITSPRPTNSSSPGNIEHEWRERDRELFPRPTNHSRHTNSSSQAGRALDTSASEESRADLKRARRRDVSLVSHSDVSQVSHAGRLGLSSSRVPETQSLRILQEYDLLDQVDGRGSSKVDKSSKVGGSSKVAIYAESFAIPHPILSPAPGRLDQEDKVTDLLVPDKVTHKVMDKVTDKVTNKVKRSKREEEEEEEASVPEEDSIPSPTSVTSVPSPTRPSRYVYRERIL